MDYGARRYLMDEDFVGVKVPAPRPVKSLMSYVGYIITAGVVGIVAILLLSEIFM